jgi:AcrR family transcriptional regulator
LLSVDQESEVSSADLGVQPPLADDQDRTARARIRDAALVRFAADGVAGTSLKAIAADVGVSPPLVIHHFGSKEGLRIACDEYVVAMIRESKRAVANRTLDPLQGLRDTDRNLPLVRYLARTLSDGSPHVATLIDEMVEDAVAYSAEAVAHGVMKPTEYPRDRIVVLVMWQLGALALHEHVERLLGVDLTSDLEGLFRWARPAGEILAKGAISEELYEQLRAGAPDAASESN